MHRFVQPAASLWLREIKRFVRDRSRAVSTLATALLFWGLIGLGLRGSFSPAGVGVNMGAVEYLFPGTVVFVVLLTAILGTFSLIEDRREGFLQGVLVAPVARSAIPFGKVLGGATVGLIQGALLLALAPLVGVPVTLGGAALGLMVLLVLAFGLSSLGFILAWRVESIHGFHGIVNLVLMPMWFLSGALFPVAGAAGWLQGVMRANPLSYGLVTFRDVLYGGATSPWVTTTTATWVTLAFTAAAFGAAVAAVRR